MEKVLFTRQRHEADRAGLHWDYRLVIGDKAHSWATKKELPEPGKSIMLWQQPVHTAHYALSKKVIIPKGQYGAGTTVLDWVKKGTAEMEQDKIVINTNDGRFLLKKMPNYGDGSGWLFKQLPKENNTMEKKAKESRYETAIKKVGTIAATGTVGGTVSAFVGRHLAKKDREKRASSNKYLDKIASDLALAKKSKGEEDTAIKDYTDRLKVEKNPILRKATQHALEEEKTHSKLFAKAKADIKK